MNARDSVRRLATGSAMLTRRIGQALTPEGRPVLAAGLITATVCGTITALNAAHQAPILAPVAATVWCRRAWAAAGPPPDTGNAATETPETTTPTPDPGPARPDDPRRDLAQAVLDIIGDRPGIHLAELYPALLARPAAARLDETRLRAALTEAGITITRSMRVGDVEGRSGIKRADVQALLDPPPPGQPLSTPLHDGDAGQTPGERGGELAGERPESTQATPPERGYMHHPTEGESP
ncbi:hypothetical protein [Streptomyces sp. NPDC018031]|uniref:hypothetical protein n=1 Tax=Streptomyces sp. NPDC018031 TaxID=3365033 RepID=UPI0037B94BC8